MNHKLKSTNGRVNCLLKSGNDFVKNKISVNAAQHIIDKGTMTTSDREDYPICIDETWYFEGEKISASAKKEK